MVERGARVSASSGNVFVGAGGSAGGAYSVTFGEPSRRLTQVVEELSAENDRLRGRVESLISLIEANPPSRSERDELVKLRAFRQAVDKAYH